jgi:hypothetical protein
MGARGYERGWLAMQERGFGHGGVLASRRRDSPWRVHESRTGRGGVAGGDGGTTGNAG